MPDRNLPDEEILAAVKRLEKLLDSPLKEIALDLDRMKTDLQRIRMIVEGETGDNGLKTRVRELEYQLQTIQTDLKNDKLADEKACAEAEKREESFIRKVSFYIAVLTAIGTLISTGIVRMSHPHAESKVEKK